ncbi:MAG: hypothetical protein IJZ10_05085, partial [Thermoguttaceae bacterium]|nr:hypothetical protein [Thermoguttaceae bacterium]
PDVGGRGGKARRLSAQRPLERPTLEDAAEKRGVSPLNARSNARRWRTRRKNAAPLRSALARTPDAERPEQTLTL